ncbi:hypothetical protein PR001_g28159 [Phytophthora rubi]|uniref:Uncharacterized protein n=1 Tax=Phytophthora rubi TaxID=129364 RepID=A0A6A3HEM5_9STRA|nr:hypothetical protein PR001_g28159 [Phytophthora rubi]
MQAPPGSRAGHCSTATTTSSSGADSSSSIAGVDASPATSSSSGADSISSIAGVDASPASGSSSGADSSSSSIAGVDASPATSSSSGAGSSSSSSIAGVDARLLCLVLRATSPATSSGADSSSRIAGVDEGKPRVHANSLDSGQQLAELARLLQEPSNAPNPIYDRAAAPKPGSISSSQIIGVDASPAWKPSWPLPHRHHDQQQQQHCREKMRLMQGKPRVH